MSFTDSPICQSRKSCWACRKSASWRELHGAPEICPFTAAKPEPENFEASFLAAAKAQPPTPVEEGPLMREPEINEICKKCKFMTPSGCRQCGCPDAKVKPWFELSRCPKGYWTKRYD